MENFEGPVKEIIIYPPKKLKPLSISRKLGWNHAISERLLLKEERSMKNSVNN